MKRGNGGSSSNNSNNSPRQDGGTTPKKAKNYQPSPLRQSWTAAPNDLRSPGRNLSTIMSVSSPDLSFEATGEQQEHLTSPSARRSRRKSNLKDQEEPKPDDRRKSTGRRVSFAPKLHYRPFDANGPIRRPGAADESETEELQSPTPSDTSSIVPDVILPAGTSGGLFGGITDLMSTRQQTENIPFDLEAMFGAIAAPKSAQQQQAANGADHQPSGHSSFEVDLPSDHSTLSEKQPAHASVRQEQAEESETVEQVPDEVITYPEIVASAAEHGTQSATSNMSPQRQQASEQQASEQQASDQHVNGQSPKADSTPQRQHSFGFRSARTGQSPALTDYAFGGTPMAAMQDVSIIPGAGSDMGSDSPNINFAGDTTRPLVNESPLPLPLNSPSGSPLVSQNDTPRGVAGNRVAELTGDTPSLPSPGFISPGVFVASSSQNNPPTGSIDPKMLAFSPLPLPLSPTTAGQYSPDQISPSSSRYHPPSAFGSPGTMLSPGINGFASPQTFTAMQDDMSMYLNNMASPDMNAFTFVQTGQSPADQLYTSLPITTEFAAAESPRSAVYSPLPASPRQEAPAPQSDEQADNDRSGGEENPFAPTAPPSVSSPQRSAQIQRSPEPKADALEQPTLATGTSCQA
ncbi:hypothetical protein RI367_004679 [Sorochytrium milnesiophthora]